jgi:hypothetical protein
LGSDLAFGGAEAAAEADLGAALEHANKHDVGDADRADQQRDGAEAEEQSDLIASREMPSRPTLGLP